MTTGSQRRCAVLGSPVAHSLSPVLHRAAYRATGLDWSYDAREVREADLGSFIDSLDESWRGLSLTKPLKRAVVPLADELSEPARRAQAANTLILDGGRRIADNTDIPGVTAAIRERVTRNLESAVILGGGATATSVLLALADLGCRKLTLVVRDPSRAQDTLAAAGRHPDRPEVVIAGFDAEPTVADILVSTIPAHAEATLALPLAEQIPVIFDVVYDPWPTALGYYARTEGRILVSGMDLLVHQACGQFTLMTGIADAPLDAMREAGERALAERASTKG